MKIRLVVFRTPEEAYTAATSESREDIMAGWLSQIVEKKRGANLVFMDDDGTTIILPASICLQTIVEIEEHDGEFNGKLTNIFWREKH